MVCQQCSREVDSSKQSVAIYKTGKQGLGAGEAGGLQGTSRCPASAGTGRSPSPTGLTSAEDQFPAAAFLSLEQI